MKVEGDVWGADEVTNVPIITTEELDWFYGSDVMPPPQSLDQRVVDPVPYYLWDAPAITQEELKIKSSLKNWFENTKARRAIQTQIHEIDDVQEDSFFFNSRFESGNLKQVWRDSDTGHYKLFLDFDQNNDNNFT